MRCPKCQYIGFDQADRCRNCGYDFSLSADLDTPDLPIKTGDEPLGPLADFTLADRDLDAAPPVAPRSGDRSGPAPARSQDLPLFRERFLDDDAPLVSLPATPRAPVSVRKSATARPMPQRQAVEEPALDLEPAGERVPSRIATPRAPQVEEPSSDAATASVGARLLGAGIDVTLLAAIDVVVLYFTLLVCDLTFPDVSALPVVPFLAFIALLNGGYKAAFTAAGGQTLGKMAAGTRVINADESGASDRVALGQAIVRAAAYGLSVVTAGLGFLPVIFSADRRAFHDRLAHTRVVKA